jgi:hypothetical protein
MSDAALKALREEAESYQRMRNESKAAEVTDRPDPQAPTLRLRLHQRLESGTGGVRQRGKSRPAMSPSYECPVCHAPLMGPNETCGGSFTESDHPSAVAAVPVSGPEQVEDRWPVIVVVKTPDGSHLLDPCDERSDELKEEGIWKAQTYYPADHPAVLTPDEAGMCMRALRNMGEPVELRELADRLSTWAEGEETK